VVALRGWRIAPEHFAERHGLIVLIALGESIIAIGVGAGFELVTGVLVAGALGVVVVSALWWLWAIKQLDADHAELKPMHTAIDARRRGVGRALVDQRVAVAAARGARRVSLVSTARRSRDRAGLKLGTPACPITCGKQKEWGCSRKSLQFQ
jgi:GNAT superfamily N-acetyltransferase